MVRRGEAGGTCGIDEEREGSRLKKREKNVLLEIPDDDDDDDDGKRRKRKETEKGRTRHSPRTDAACFSILS